MTKILLVEDDKAIVANLTEFLNNEGYLVKSVSGQSAAMNLLAEERSDLVLLDVSLAEGNGFATCKAIKAEYDIPVIFLTASGDEYSTVTGFDLGADDYILKPFDLNEVQVRIEVVLRRSGIGTSSVNGTISCGDLCFNTNENSVTYQGKPIALTAKELMLLKLFMEYPQKVYTKANLYESVWNDTYYYEDNTINVHVSNLRSKLKKATGNDYIETVWGIGYRLKGE